MKLRLALGGMLLIGAAYFTLFGGDYGLFELRRVRRERALEQQRADSLRIAVDQLQARRDSLLHDAATIERVARERYGLIRDGERLYRFAGAADSGRAARRSNSPPDSVRAAPPDTTR